MQTQVRKGNMPKLVLDNLKLGQRADGGLKDDALFGLRRLVNYELIYGGPTVDLRVRPGYERWNANNFATPAKQVRVFVDQLRNQHILMNLTDLWYEAKQTGAHTRVSPFASTAPSLFETWGNRAFLGTDGTDDDDSCMIWTDHEQLLTGADNAYRLGIKKPETPIGLELHEKEGHHLRISATQGLPINSTQTKIAIRYTPSLDQSVREIWILLRREYLRQNLSGNFRVKIYTDDGNKPSDTLVDDNAVSDWREVCYFDRTNSWDDASYRRFILMDFVKLTAGVRVWLVVEADVSYYENVIYHDPYEAYDFFGMIGASTDILYGESQYYNTVSDTWASFATEAMWYLGGMIPDKFYDYVYTYFNEEYQIESRPSDKVRISPKGEGLGIYIKYFETSSDPQVDRVKVYRREVDSEQEVEEDITTFYHFLTELETGETINDTTATAHLGAVLQTLDHYCLDDISEEEDSGIRTAAIIPTCSCMWKGRLWVGEETNATLKYSKIFEEDGSTGMIGLSSPDYFPLDNTITIPEPGYPINIYPISNDQLVVHMSNDTTYLIYGGDQSLNPPADFAIIPFLDTGASIGIWCGTLWSHYHFFLSKNGLYRSTGMGVSVPEFVSEENQSILDKISTSSLKLSRIIPVGDEVWTLIDWDNDGILDTVFIADMQRDIPTRQGIEHTFRMYQYNVKLNDIDSVSVGDDLQAVYACDAENGYILKLNTGTLDHETAISAYAESHDLVGENQSMIDQIDLDVFMPDLDNRPAYTWLLTDHAGNTATGTMAPQTNEDIRRMRSGTRLKGALSVRARVSQVSTVADILRSIAISFNTE